MVGTAAAGNREGSQEWRWPTADVSTYVALVRGLAASLRVSDAIATVGDVRRRGVPPGDEVNGSSYCALCSEFLDSLRKKSFERHLFPDEDRTECVSVIHATRFPSAKL